MRERAAAALLVAALAPACTGTIAGREAAEGDNPPVPAASASAVASPPPAPFPTGTPLPSPSDTSCAGLQAFPPLVRRLTRLEYDNTVRALLGDATTPARAFVADEKVGPFDGNAGNGVTELLAEQLLEAAEAVAARAITRLPTLLPCDPRRGESACARQFIAQFGRRAFRRPLVAAEAGAYAALFETARTEGAFAAGIQAVLEAMLQSPHFLYQMEIGTPLPGSADVLLLSPFQIASRLSFLLWSAPPDDALLAAAESGALATAEGLAAEARRLLAAPAAGATLASFHLQWLGVENVERVDKDRQVFPEWSAALAGSMRRETERFVQEVARGSSPRLDSLLTAPWTFADAPLAKLYAIGGGAPAGPDLARVSLDAAKRVGVLGHASVLAEHAKSDQTSPVLRGKFVRERLLCQEPPPPPADVDVTVPPPSPTLSTRERFSEHRKNPSCAACHELMDPIGFGFEHFDAIGRHRGSDAGKPVDATGTLVGTDVDGAFSGVPALAARLATSGQVARCYTTSWVRFAVARHDLGSAACALDQLTARSVARGGDLRELLIDLVKSDAFRFQRAN